MNAESHSLSKQFWEPTRSLTLATAYKHTQFIKLLRLTCIMGALCLVALMTYYFLDGDGTAQTQANVGSESVRMTNPRYTGLDGDDMPYSLTAEYALREIDNPDAVRLVSPVLKFVRLEGMPSSTITAVEGIYEHSLQILELRNDVKVNTDDGYVCESKHARIKTLDKIVEGDGPIRCDGRFGHVEGERFEILDNYSRFIFLDNVQALLLPSDGNSLEGSDMIDKDAP